MKSILLIVLDGLGDRPNPVLNNRTALQAAFRPNMNYLAAGGQTGQMHPVKPGIRSGSDTSHLSLLGYDPEKFYTGRGPFEAMGLGLDVRGGDIAFRANFGTRKENGEISDRRAGRISNGTELLAKDLSMNIDGVDFFVKAGVEHRAAMVMRGDNLSDMVTDSDPHEVGMKVHEISATGKSAEFTAEVLNKYLKEARKILDAHELNLERKKHGELPANELLLRGAGLAPKLPLFREKTDLKGACISGIPMVSGICRLAGMDLINVIGATGKLDSNFSAKFAAAFEALGTYDFLIMNIKATDVAGHDGDAIAKKNAIERIDRAMEGIQNHLDDSVICITGDHSTPCVMKDHSGDPVPIVFNTSGIRKDSVKLFDEISCSGGSHNIMSGDVQRILLQLSDRAAKYGA